MGYAQRLAIILMSVEGDKLSMDVVRIEPHEGLIPLEQRLQVFWQSEPTNKESYWSVYDGLAWVRKNDLYEEPEGFRSTRQPANRLVLWAEYVDGILAFLPKQHSATSLKPPPMAAAVQGRVALWWAPPPNSPYHNQRTIEWMLTPLIGGVEASVDLINAGGDADEGDFPAVGLE